MELAGDTNNGLYQGGAMLPSYTTSFQCGDVHGKLMGRGERLQSAKVEHLHHEPIDHRAASSRYQLYSACCALRAKLDALALVR
jgi:hypothetical protein